MDIPTEVNQTSLVVNTSSGNVDANCVEYNVDDEKMLNFNVFWVEGVTLILTAVVGLIGNMISIFILNKEDLRTFFSHLLIVLSSFDSLYLLLSIIEAFRRSFKLISNIHIYLFPYFLYPIHSLIMAASIYMTIAIAVERFRAVLFPIRLRLMLLTSKRMYKRRLFKYVSPVVMCAVLISIPRFFELKVIMPSEALFSSSINETYSSLLNETINNGTTLKTMQENEGKAGPQIGMTSLRTDMAYNLYYVNITRFLLTGAGPISLLVFFYYRIFRAVQGHNVVQSQVTVSQLDEATRQKQEDALSRLFTNIIVLFIVCHLPRVLINFYEMMVIDIALECYDKGMSAYGAWVQVLICYSHLLLVTNASVNIIFYIWHNKAFKGHFLAIIGRGSGHNSETTFATAAQRPMRSSQRKTEETVINVEVHETNM